MGIHWPTQFILNISHVVDIEIGRHSFQKICMAFVKKKKKKKNHLTAGLQVILWPLELGTSLLDIVN